VKRTDHASSERVNREKTLPVLDAIQKRVLWLSAWMVYRANARPAVDGTKVGGHQASSASVVSLLTALYFGALGPDDVVAVKAHAAPAFYAIQYLRGRLRAADLEALRDFDGLQAYPSRRKNPGIIDLSTGSMGLGAVAATFGALATRYIADHLPLMPAAGGHGGPVEAPHAPTDKPTHRAFRYVVMVGDAELDEGNVWEAMGEEIVSTLDNVLWIVDINRQSLDRIIADGRPRQLAGMFAAAGWHVIELRYGSRLRELFARGGGERLRQRLDAMSHRDYHRLLRSPAGVARKALVTAPDGSIEAALDRLLASVGDDELIGLVADLGGHDLALIQQAYAEAAQVRTRPTVILAHTIKGWGLPFAADPLNHTMITTDAQIVALRDALGITAGAEWHGFAPSSAEAAWIDALPPLFSPPPPPAVPEVPDRLDEEYGPRASTQEAFGRVLGALGRLPVADAIVTTSADVAITTHLSGWMNRRGIYWPVTRRDPFADTPQAVTWKESPEGQHVELGIAEHDLFLLLGAFGLSAELAGTVLLPIGTLYDPFITRGLDALYHALYAGGKFVVVATPSGISLSPEGGAHQSVITPGIGVALPGITYYEPAFAREVEWILLNALRGIADRSGDSLYLRLTTKPVDQTLAPPATAGYREGVLRGGYRRLDARAEPGYHAERAVHVFAAGAMVPEALQAATELRKKRHIFPSVFVVTSPDLLYRGLRERRPYLEELVGADEEDVPIVSVLDGHSHALAFLGSALGVPQMALGVDTFGQSGVRADLYRHYGVDADAVVRAACVLLGG
jgi:pyruvate dehydrogenase E1 component